MKHFNYKGFKQELKEKTVEAFEDYKQQNGIEHLCGFAFYTDEAFMTLSVILNTRDNLKHLQDEDPDEADYFRFAVDEWNDDVEFANEKLDSLNELLNEPSVENDPDNDFLNPDYVDKLMRIFTEVINEMKAAGCFEGVGNDFIWYVAISDSFEPSKELEIFRQLNTPALMEEFSEWMETQEEFESWDEEED